MHRIFRVSGGKLARIAAKILEEVRRAEETEWPVHLGTQWISVRKEWYGLVNRAALVDRLKQLRYLTDLDIRQKEGIVAWGADWTDLRVTKLFVELAVACSSWRPFYAKSPGMCRGPSFCRPTRTRTWNDRTKICCVTNYTMGLYAGPCTPLFLSAYKDITFRGSGKVPVSNFC